MRVERVLRHVPQSIPLVQIERLERRLLDRKLRKGKADQRSVHERRQRLGLVEARLLGRHDRLAVRHNGRIFGRLLVVQLYRRRNKQWVYRTVGLSLGRKRRARKNILILDG
jgi:hypothetical protein